MFDAFDTFALGVVCAIALAAFLLADEVHSLSACLDVQTDISACQAWQGETGIDTGRE